MLDSLKKLLQKYTSYTLIISGGGTKGFYALGVLKALEEAGLRKQIKAIYGISVGGIIAAYRSAGRSAQQIFDTYKDLDIANEDRLTFFSTKNFLDNKFLAKKFKQDLPISFEELEIPTYIGATNMKTAKLIFFHKGELLSPILGTMALPGIFPSVKYENYLLNDGGIIDNFPTHQAQKTYPNNPIIGISLNMFKQNQEPKNIIETLMLSLEIMMRKDIVERVNEIEISFYDKIDCGILELDKKKRVTAFNQGYKSGTESFSKLAK